MKPLSKEDLAQINGDLGQWLLQQLRELMRTLCPSEGDKEFEEEARERWECRGEGTERGIRPQLNETT